MKKGVLRKLLGDRRGISAMEYALMAAAVVVGLGAAFGSFKDKIVNSLGNTGNQL